ncbi:hypothetical protein D3C86_1863640 [compost metagenome]
MHPLSVTAFLTQLDRLSDQVVEVGFVEIPNGVLAFLRTVLVVVLGHPGCETHDAYTSVHTSLGGKAHMRQFVFGLVNADVDHQQGVVSNFSVLSVGLNVGWNNTTDVTHSHFWLVLDLVNGSDLVSQAVLNGAE